MFEFLFGSLEGILISFVEITIFGGIEFIGPRRDGPGNGVFIVKTSWWVDGNSRGHPLFGGDFSVSTGDCDVI